MNSDDLDNQIRLALDGEPKAEQLARLEDFWHAQSHSGQRRRGWRRGSRRGVDRSGRRSVVGS